MMLESDQSQDPLADGLHMSASRFGLCVTCNNAGICVFRKHRGCDALYCETFDNFVSTNGRRRKALVLERAKPVADVAGLKGLCVNCAHASECRLSRPTGGVWHCGEYE